jgi:alkylated DNA repair dioxygenase AlkB
MRAKLSSISQLASASDVEGCGIGNRSEAQQFSGLRYQPDYLAREAADELRRVLTMSMVWRREKISMYGRTIPVPRQVAWCGDSGINYRYSGQSHVARGWPDCLTVYRDRLESLLGCRFNFALLNLYCDGSDYMGWHRDDELGAGAVVASISLGGRRRFLVRQAGESRSKRLDLDHGSLLVFPGTLSHSLPRCQNAVERLNITFRTINQNSEC